jgi:serine protease inhibitor ecotin
MTWRWDLDEDLEEAVLLGALTQAEAWVLMDDRLLNPEEPYPDEFRPMLRRLRLVELDPQEMTRH